MKTKTRSSRSGHRRSKHTTRPMRGGGGIATKLPSVIHTGGNNLTAAVAAQQQVHWPIAFFLMAAVALASLASLYTVSKQSLWRGGGSFMSTGSPLNINVTANARPNYVDDGVPPTNPLAGWSLPSSMSAALSPFYQGTRNLVPVNVPTRPSSGSIFQQIGIISNDDKVLPLMGRRMDRDRWQYYTVSDNNMNLKIPISFGGREGTSEYGLKEISSGDTVKVDSFGENKNSFNVKLYDNMQLRYI